MSARARRARRTPFYALSAQRVVADAFATVLRRRGLRFHWLFHGWRRWSLALAGPWPSAGARVYAWRLRLGPVELRRVA